MLARQAASMCQHVQTTLTIMNSFVQSRLRMRSDLPLDGNQTLLLAWWAHVSAVHGSLWPAAADSTVHRTRVATWLKLAAAAIGCASKTLLCCHH